MKNVIYIFYLIFSIFLSCGSNVQKPDNEESPVIMEIYLSVNPEEISIKATGGTQYFTITANKNWTLSSNVDWCIISHNSGVSGKDTITVTAMANYSGIARTAELTVSIDSISKKCIVHQETAEMPNYVPDGYTLVWQDEFNDERLSGGKPALPNTSEWWYENGASGWGNNEIQNYISGFSGKDTCAKIHDGTLKIIAKKVGNQVLSVRMNTNKSWCYGYFEARIKMPAGKGTWPAFWMLPKNFVNWPHDGEIDIVEFVGFNPNQVHSSIHCKAYNHLNNTEKTASKHIPTAQTDFHVYAVEWTEYYIHGYVDGVRYFVFNNDKTGNKDTWPFNAPFYLKLNLAWGGNWGGAHGVDETALPATYEIDYVRVYQIIP